MTAKLFLPKGFKQNKADDEEIKDLKGQLYKTDIFILKKDKTSQY